MLKKVIIIFFILSGSACQPALSPVETATAFIQAMQQGRFAAAEKYATSESVPLINALAHAGNRQLFPITQDQTFQIRETLVQENSIHLTITIRETGQSLNWVLKKESGKWKVAYDLNTLLQSATEGS